MPTYAGPDITLVETISHEAFLGHGGFRPGARPLLVRGAVTGWPAWHSLSFDRLATLAQIRGDQARTTFQNGLVEQGATNQPLELSILPFLEHLADASTTLHDPDAALCPDHVLAALSPEDRFHLNWQYLSTFSPDRPYLAQWDILAQFPQLEEDIRLSELWRWRSNWPSVWIGPAGTVTGLHKDYPNNWFCQFRGEKEFIMFAPANARLMSPSRKYDSGSVLSRIDITRLHQASPEAELFAQAEGIYARVRPGDALYVPADTWHCVVSLEPSISLSVFGLTVAERLTGGVRDTVLGLLHQAGWYRKGNCTCHKHEGS